MEDLKIEYQQKVTLGFGTYVDIKPFPKWGLARIDEMSRFATSFSTLINQTTIEGIGPHGVSGNAQIIVFAAKKLGELYRDSILWIINL